MKSINLLILATVCSAISASDAGVPVAQYDQPAFELFYQTDRVDRNGDDQVDELTADARLDDLVIGFGYGQYGEGSSHLETYTTTLGIVGDTFIDTRAILGIGARLSFDDSDVVSQKTITQTTTQQTTTVTPSVPGNGKHLGWYKPGHSIPPGIAKHGVTTTTMDPVITVDSSSTTGDRDTTYLDGILFGSLMHRFEHITATEVRVDSLLDTQCATEINIGIREVLHDTVWVGFVEQVRFGQYRSQAAEETADFDRGLWFDGGITVGLVSLMVQYDLESDNMVGGAAVRITN